MITLRGGYSTGACAAAAAKAAAMILCGNPAPTTVDIVIADGSHVTFPIVSWAATNEGVQVTIRKDAGDDPDITNQAQVIASVSYSGDNDLHFLAGDGVGIVTKRGLSIPPGEPAINPVPRRMIRDAMRSVTARGLNVTISIPGGRELAEQTFNPRLGIVGGLSILGTTGRVRPFSVPALQTALRCALNIAAEAGVASLVLVPGNIGERAALKHFRITPEQVVHASNELGFMLDETSGYSFSKLLVVGHPGKLAKVIDGEWDTHSGRSSSAVPIVRRVCADILQRKAPESPTVEGVFSSLCAEERKYVADALAAEIRTAIIGRIGARQSLAVALINMAGDLLGRDGDLLVWQ